MKKLALIKINRPDGSYVLLNPGDIKIATITKPAQGNSTLTFVTSSDFDLAADELNDAGTAKRLTFSVSNYAVDQKIRPALRQRYNVVDVRTGYPIRRSGNDKTHDIIAVTLGSVTTLVFPRGLNSVELNGDTVVVRPSRSRSLPLTVNVRSTKDDHELFEARRLVAVSA